MKHESLICYHFSLPKCQILAGKLPRNLYWDSAWIVLSARGRAVPKNRIHVFRYSIQTPTREEAETEFQSKEASDDESRYGSEQFLTLGKGTSIRSNLEAKFQNSRMFL